MKTLDLIRKLRDIENRMDAARTKVAVYKSIAEKTTASLSSSSGSGSSTLTAHEDAVIRLMEAEQKYDETALEYQRTVDEVMNRISIVKNREKRTVAVAIIIKNQTFGDVAKALHMARSSIYRIYGEVIQKIDAET